MWLLLNESQTESQADAVVIEEPAATEKPPSLPEADTVVIEEPAATGQPPPLPEADTVVIEEPAATGQPPLLPTRRAGSRQPAPDHSGQPCGCGCGQQLEQRDYRTCPFCVNKDPAMAYNKIRVSCWGGGKSCTVCSDVTGYNYLIAPAFFNGYKKI
jgi:hypothetical protein